MNYKRMHSKEKRFKTVKTIHFLITKALLKLILNS